MEREQVREISERMKRGPGERKERRRKEEVGEEGEEEKGRGRRGKRERRERRGGYAIICTFEKSIHM